MNFQDKKRGVMKQFLVSYIISAVVFISCDAAWLSIMGPRVYKPLLQGLLSDTVRPTPAILFYILYLTGIVVFAVLPSQKPLAALGYGALFGLISYATYDLTNQATLHTWPPLLTIMDLSWGALVTGVTALLAYVISRKYII